MSTIKPEKPLVAAGKPLTGGQAASSTISVKDPVKRGASQWNHWVPNTDVYAAEDGLVVKLELAGLAREDLELSIKTGQLVIRGQRESGLSNGSCKFLATEIQYGQFECVINIPEEYDLNQAQAIYRNGFLRVDIPRRPTSGN